MNTKHIIRSFTGIFLATSLLACSGELEDTSDATKQEKNTNSTNTSITIITNTNNGGGGGTTTPTSGGCDAPKVRCGSVCVDITQNKNHCGGCYQLCDGQSCAQSMCQPNMNTNTNTGNTNTNNTNTGNTNSNTNTGNTNNTNTGNTNTGNTNTGNTGNTNTGTGDPTLEQQMLQEVNKVRMSGYTCGGQAKPPVGPLVLVDVLNTTARKHSQDMADNGYFSHTGQDGSSPTDRGRREGYSGGLGENIAAGNKPVSAVMAQWLKSPGHCNNIMRASSKKLGVGYGYNAKSRYRHYWTQVFGR